MGGASSKQVISTDDAKRRISTEDLERLSYAYGKLHSNRGSYRSSFEVGVPFAIFDKCILCEYVNMPKKLKMMLFYAFMGRSKDCLLTFDDLLRAYAVLFLGSFEEKCTLLFYTLTVSSDGYSNGVYWEKKLDVTTVVTVNKFFASFPSSFSLQRNMLNRLFETEDYVSLEDFLAWARAPDVAKTFFVSWMFTVGAGIFKTMVGWDLGAIRLQQKKQVPVTLENDKFLMISATDISSQDSKILNWLKRQYIDLAGLLETGKLKNNQARSDNSNTIKHGINEIQLGDILSPPIPRKLVNIIFSYTDQDNVGTVDPAYFIDVLSRFLTGTDESRLCFIFDLFDRDKDGFLQKLELLNLLRALSQITEEVNDDRRLAAGVSSAMKFRNVAVRNKNGQTLDTDRANYAITTAFTHKDVLPAVNRLITNSDNNRLSRKQWITWGKQKAAFLDSIVMILNAIEVSSRQKRLSAKAELDAIVAVKSPMYAERKLRHGDIWYILSKIWWGKWEAYAKSEQNNGRANHNMVDYSSVSTEIQHGRRPGKIDQSDILSGVSKTSLRSTIFQNQDYVIINKKMWDLLSSWYGGGPAIERYVVKDGNRLELELHPVTLRISLLDCNKSTKDQLASIQENSIESRHAMAFLEITVSRFQTAADVKRIACRHFGLRYLNRVRLWDYRRNREHMLIRPVDEVECRTVEEFDFLDGQSILLEPRNQSGKWPLGTGVENKVFEPSVAKRPGVAGLYNLGNTCYINASLQGLMHVPMLSEYFCKEYHIADLNVAAKLGSKNAELACAFSLLTNELMGKDASSYAVTPRVLKRVVGRFNQMFSGYNQHDAQEFLSVFMDGLHEDLNRVKQKLYAELKDSDGRPDNIVAREWWENHLKRDNSIIQAIFAGQFKSKVVCAECKYTSNRFEPFTMLQVPLPLSVKITFEVFVIFCGSEQNPIQLALRLPKGACKILTLKRAIEAMDDEIPNYLKPNKSPLVANDLLVTYGRSTKEVERILQDQDSIRLGAKVRALHNPYVCYYAPIDSTKRYTNTSGLKPGQCVQFRDNSVLRYGKIRSVEEDNDQYLDLEVQMESEGNGQDGEFDAEDGNASYELKTIDIASLIPEYHTLCFVNRIQFNRKLYFCVETGVELIDRAFVLRLVVENTTCKELYDLVYAHSKQVIPAKLRSDQPDLEVKYDELADSNLDIDSGSPPKSTDGVPSEWNGTSVASQIQKKYGFSLHIIGVGKGNILASQVCPICPWTARCQGCLIVDSNGISVRSALKTNKFTIAVQWSKVNSNTYMRHAMASSGMKFGSPIKHESINRCEALDRKGLSIYQCINKYCKVEKMDGKDQVYCGKCKTHQDHTKQVTLYRPPPVLIIHLKRFKFTQQYSEKIMTEVRFPLVGLDLSFAYASKSAKPVALDMTWWEYLGGKYSSNKDSVPGHNGAKGAPTVAQASNPKSQDNNVEIEHGKFMYDCVGVVNHLGGTTGGHYVAYAKNSYDHKWRQYDDSHVKVVSHEHVQSRNAYIMFYMRRDFADTGVEKMFACKHPSQKERGEFKRLIAATTKYTGVLEKCIMS